MKKKKYMPFLILAVLVLAIMIVLFPLGKTKKELAEQKTTETWAENDADLFIDLGSGLYIVGVNSYMGDYVEDGTNEFVENIMMLTLENKGEENIQLATVTLNDTYIFEFTTLLPGKKLIALEKNRAEFEEDLVISSVEIGNVAFFAQSPSMQEELLEITGEESVITIKNISGEDFAGGKVFYKNVLDSYYLGGITYFGTIPALKSGEEIKVSARHYSKDSSEFVFVTYAE